MRRFVLGTAGHVDHGKTTLVKALTGVDTDRLAEEKRRGITIELGFARWRLTEGIEASLIDVPGHRRLVHTMIAGAAGIEMVLLVVAADEGVMPQTREHVAACELLGIRRAVVAVTKLDRVGPEVAALAGEEARELLGDRWEASVVACSARSGEGLEGLRAAVASALAALPPRAPSGRARLGVDRVFSVRGAGTVVTGTLVEGKIAVGAPLFLVGEGGPVEVVVRGLHVHDSAVASAEAPTRLAVNLGGVSLEAVARGDVLTNDERARPVRAVAVRVKAEVAPKRGAGAQVYAGTARSSARIDALSALEEEGTFLARLRFAHPLVVLGGDRFVLRGSDPSGPAGAVVGGGEVLDADPPRRRAPKKRAAVLHALAAGDAIGSVRALAAEASPRALPRSALSSRFVIPEGELTRAADTLAGRGELTAVKGVGWVESAGLLDLARMARRLVAEHHRGAPLDRGLALETLRQRLGASAGPEVAALAIRLAGERTPGLSGEVLVVEGGAARLAGVVPSIAATGALHRVASALDHAGLAGLTEFAAKEAGAVTGREAKAILAKLVRDGVAAASGDLWFARAAVGGLVRLVEDHLARRGRLTIAELKELSGLGRRQTIPLLELLDREGTTRRARDDEGGGYDRLPGK